PPPPLPPLPRYFRSEYFHRDKAAGVKSAVAADDMFSRIEDATLRAELDRRRAEGPRPTPKLGGAGRAREFDLTASLGVERPLGLRRGAANVQPDRDEEGDGEAVDDGTIGKRKVIQKYNRHGSIALEVGEDDEEDEAAEQAESGGMERHREMQALSERAAAPAVAGGIDVSKFETVKMKAIGGGGGGGGVGGVAADPEAFMRVLEANAARMKAAAQTSHDIFGSDPAKYYAEGKKANYILKTLSTSMSESTHVDQRAEEFTKTIPKEFMGLLDRFYKETNETLRHYFSFLKGEGNDKDELRIQKLVNKIKEQHDLFVSEEKTLREKGDLGSRNKARMIEPIISQLSHAFAQAPGSVGGAKGGWL
ncbi:hypothetical protein TeGR_g9674, partial [Tetraparma gracilis]